VPPPRSKGGGQQYGFAPPHILEQNLQFPGKFAERPFFLLLFLGIFKNLAPSLKISFRRL
jgi:hypothetical protein